VILLQETNRADDRRGRRLIRRSAVQPGVLILKIPAGWSRRETPVQVTGPRAGLRLSQKRVAVVKRR
jgi:hypothetical protein